MLEKEKLLDTLFNSKKEKHLNFKFCRGFSENISVEDFCKEVNSAIVQFKSGLANVKAHFGDANRKTINVSQLPK